VSSASREVTERTQRTPNSIGCSARLIDPPGSLPASLEAARGRPSYLSRPTVDRRLQLGPTPEISARSFPGARVNPRAQAHQSPRKLPRRIRISAAPMASRTLRGGGASARSLAAQMASPG
jgi:hypothetical protein